MSPEFIEHPAEIDSAGENLSQCPCIFFVVVSKWRSCCHCAPEASAAGNADRNHSELMVPPGEVKHNN